MGSESGQYEAVCKGEFAELHAKLDRLEMAERVRSRLVWLVAGAAVTLAATAVWRYVFAG